MQLKWAAGAVQPPEQRAYVGGELLGSLANDLSGTDRNRSRQLQLVSSDCNNAFLISPLPMRERPAANRYGDGAV